MRSRGTGRWVAATKLGTGGGSADTSPGQLPVITSSSSAASATVRASGPVTASPATSTP
jgi:hypothetical protein